MLKRIKCWLFGHDWISRGFHNTRIQLVVRGKLIGYNHENLEYFYCSRCKKEKLPYTSIKNEHAEIE